MFGGGIDGGSHFVGAAVGNHLGITLPVEKVLIFPVPPCSRQTRLVGSRLLEVTKAVSFILLDVTGSSHLGIMHLVRTILVLILPVPC